MVISNKPVKKTGKCNNFVSTKKNSTTPQTLMMAVVALPMAWLKAAKKFMPALVLAVTGTSCGVARAGRHSQLLMMAPSTAQRKIMMPSKVFCKKRVPTVAMTKMGLGVEVRTDKCWAVAWVTNPLS